MEVVQKPRSYYETKILLLLLLHLPGETKAGPRPCQSSDVFIVRWRCVQGQGGLLAHTAEQAARDDTMHTARSNQDAYRGGGAAQRERHGVCGSGPQRVGRQDELAGISGY